MKEPATNLNRRRSIAIRDALIISIVSAILYVIAERIDAFSRLSRFAATNQVQIARFDEIIIVLSLLPLAFAVFAVRRWRELRQEIAAHDQVQQELQQANIKLGAWIVDLEQTARSTTLLTEMSDLLQACFTTEEAYGVIGQYAERLFVGASGALYMLNPARSQVEAVATWGTAPIAEHYFTPSECWALRRGQVHQVSPGQAGPCCEHVGQLAAGNYICVPMLAQGQALGLLHVRGLRVNAITAPAVGDHAWEAPRQLAITVTERIAMAMANLKLRELLRHQSTRDPLTNLFNRRYMEEVLEREVRRAIRHRQSLGLIMLDLDHFKHFNDTYGHGAGDALLREFGNFILERLRKEDIACRYGGEEFTLILLQASLADTRQRAEQLCEAIKQLGVEYNGKHLGPVTLSAGVAAFPEHGDSSDALAQIADAALYRAKLEGRDRVVVAQTESDRDRPPYTQVKAP